MNHELPLAHIPHFENPGASYAESTFIVVIHTQMFKRFFIYTIYIEIRLCVVATDKMFFFFFELLNE